ncbi:hypothetical protein [Kitasatospora viridis]|uniref:Lipoprotein n=1 Tax=Kitasatospora viridis TaxID=281105 RepID=A0A561UMQ1_9ACTN|nr:hypothetical protein [Kitasatospora viridis]TWG00646.1 hypothetical protein FHX73_114526 [Kitasatospora viridis]
MPGTHTFRSLPPAALLFGGVLLVTACGSSAQPHPVRSGDAIGTVVTPSPTPPTYGEDLSTDVGPVNDALAKLPQAGSLDDLNSSLDGLSSAASTGSNDLMQAKVPDNVSDANRQLYVALQTLSSNITALKQDISGSKYCATSSALAAAGGMQGLKDIQTALQAVTGDGYSTTFTVPNTGQLQQRSLGNGSAVRQGDNSGNGEMTVDNSNGDGDAVITLASNGQAAYSFYVDKGQTAKMNGIRDGHYDIFFTGGVDWDSGTKQFTQNCNFSKFDQGNDFTTTSTTYSTLTITLKASFGQGNASTSDVPPGQYPTP